MLEVETRKNGEENPAVGKEQETSLLYEARSPEIQNIIGSIPPWITRWGITVIAIITVGIFISAAVLKYPDTVSSEITIAHAEMPVIIRANESTSIERLFVGNEKWISKGQVIALLRSEANYTDLNTVKAIVQEIDTAHDPVKIALAYHLDANMHLSSLQSVFNDFRFSIEEIALRAPLTAEAKSKQIVGLRSSSRKLLEMINAWEEKFVLKSPIDGKVEFLREFKSGEWVNSGEVMLAITPTNSKELKISATIKPELAYKVRKGQEVRISLAEFPSQEYGTIKGIIKSVFPIAVNSQYVLNIRLLNGLISSSKKPIPFKFQYRGTGEIIIKNKSVLEHLVDMQGSN